MMLNFRFEKQGGKTIALYPEVSLSHSQPATALRQEQITQGGKYF